MSPPARARLRPLSLRFLARVVPALLLLAAPGPAASQGVPRVTTGWGVDTASAAWSEAAWHPAVPEIYRAWRDYLLSDPHLQRPTPHWSAAEQERWPGYDLTASLAYEGFPATVLDIRPAGGAAPVPGPSAVPDTFVVKTLFAAAKSEERAVKPVALTRVYALREEGRWVFANALPRLTRGWGRVEVGPVTYVVEPGLAVDRARARGAVAFADSLAGALGLPELEGVTYYLAGTPERLHRVMGVDWTFGGLGHGYVLPWNQMILSGDAAFGEANRHELAHYVLRPLVEERRTHPIVSEGMATWLGGSTGLASPELRAAYGRYLREHPGVTLDAILEANDPDRGWGPGGAVLVAMVHEEGGTEALLELLRAGRSNEALRSAASELLGVPWETVQDRWRRRATSPPG